MFQESYTKSTALARQTLDYIKNKIDTDRKTIRTDKTDQVKLSSDEIERKSNNEFLLTLNYIKKKSNMYKAFQNKKKALTDESYESEKNRFYDMQYSLHKSETYYKFQKQKSYFNLEPYRKYKNRKDYESSYDEKKVVYQQPGRLYDKANFGKLKNNKYGAQFNTEDESDLFGICFFNAYIF